MNKSTLLNVLCVIVACVALGFSPQTAFAQHGGHGGGGGFHGGGGGGFHGGAAGGFHGGGGGHYGYSGGHSYSGHHGGGYYGGHGWHGGYWGYPHYGYGWGWGWGFGFGWPYWGWGYPYGYGYSPSYSAPYPDYYPYDCPPGYTCPPNGNDDPPPPNPSPKSGSNPANPWRPPVSTPNTNYATSNVAALSSRGPILSIDRITATSSNYQVANSSTQQNPQVRPEVRRAMQALREMPPFARQREIETGRYSHFSAEEREILRSLDVKDKSEYSQLR